MVGFTGGGADVPFVIRVFIANEHPLREEDFDMTGSPRPHQQPIREEGARAR